MKTTIKRRRYQKHPVVMPEPVVLYPLKDAVKKYREEYAATQRWLIENPPINERLRELFKAYK